MRVFTLTILLLLGCGCTTATSVLLLDCDLDHYMGAADLKLVYRGTRGCYHYLDLRQHGKRRKYRISTFELRVEEPFPLDADQREINWVSLEVYGPERTSLMAGRQWVLVPIQVDGRDVYQLKLCPRRRE